MRQESRWHIPPRPPQVDECKCLHVIKARSGRPVRNAIAPANPANRRPASLGARHFLRPFLSGCAPYHVPVISMNPYRDRNDGSCFRRPPALAKPVRPSHGPVRDRRRPLLKQRVDLIREVAEIGSAESESKSVMPSPSCNSGSRSRTLALLLFINKRQRASRLNGAVSV